MKRHSTPRRQRGTTLVEAATVIAIVSIVTAVALKGENMTGPSAAMPWYQGPSLMQALETAELDDLRLQQGPLRLPIQWVNRPDQNGALPCSASNTVDSKP